MTKKPSPRLTQVKLFKLASILTQRRFFNKHAMKVSRVMRLIQIVLLHVFEHFWCPLTYRIIVSSHKTMTDNG